VQTKHGDPSCVEASPHRCCFQHPHNLPESSLARQRQRRASLRVGQLCAGASVEQRLHDSLVSRPAVAKHHRLDQGRPVQVVDVVELRAGGNELAHHAVVAQVGMPPVVPRGSLQRLLQLLDRRDAHWWSRWPPGAPPMPMAPITSHA
jgi:hypothetical protein